MIDWLLIWQLFSNDYDENKVTSKCHSGKTTKGGTRVREPMMHLTYAPLKEEQITYYHNVFLATGFQTSIRDWSYNIS